MKKLDWNTLHGADTKALERLARAVGADVKARGPRETEAGYRFRLISVIMRREKEMARAPGGQG